jgi:hypothetical protein
MGIQCLKPSRRFKPETVLINWPRLETRTITI